MTPARDAALARQAQELAEGEVVSTELPIVRELREHEDSHVRAWIAVLNVLNEVVPDWRSDWPEGKTGIDLVVDTIRALAGGLSFATFRAANVRRCERWHPQGIRSWSPSDWLTAVTGELGELASLLKMRNRERDGLVGNKFSPTDEQIASELADVVTYVDLLAEALGVDLGKAIVEKFNEVSQRNGFPDRLTLAARAAEGATDHG